MIGFLVFLNFVFIIAFLVSVIYLIFAVAKKKKTKIAARTAVSSLVLFVLGLFVYSKLEPYEENRIAVEEAENALADDESSSANKKTTKLNDFTGVGDPDSSGDYKVTIRGNSPVTMTGKATPGATIDVTDDSLEADNTEADAKGNFKVKIQLNKNKKNEYLITAKKHGYNESDIISVTAKPYQSTDEKLATDNTKKGAKERAQKESDELQKMSDYPLLGKYDLTFSGNDIYNVQVWCDESLETASASEVRHYFSYGVQIGMKALNSTKKSPIVQVYAGSKMIARSSIDNNMTFVDKR